MLAKFSHKGLSWIDLTKATPEEIAHSFEQYNIAPETLANMAYCDVTLQLPSIFSPDDESMRLIAGESYLISIHENEHPAISTVTKNFELQTIRNENADTSVAWLLTQLLASLHAQMRDELIQAEKDLALLSVQTILAFHKKLEGHQAVLETVNIALALPQEEFDLLFALYQENKERAYALMVSKALVLETDLIRAENTAVQLHKKLRTALIVVLCILILLFIQLFI